MNFMRSLLGVLLVSTALVWPAGTSWAQNPQDQEQETATTVPELAHVPSGQAVVTYLDGELTIRSNNAPLGDILHAVCEKTKAVVDEDALKVAADRRILTVLRPGQPRHVLSSLLSDEHLDFVIVASDDDPNALGRIMIFPRSKEPGARNGPAELAQNRAMESQPTQIASVANVQANNAAPEPPRARSRHRRR